MDKLKGLNPQIITKLLHKTCKIWCYCINQAKNLYITIKTSLYE